MAKRVQLALRGIRTALHVIKSRNNACGNRQLANLASSRELRMRLERGVELSHSKQLGLIIVGSITARQFVSFVV